MKNLLTSIIDGRQKTIKLLSPIVFLLLSNIAFAQPSNVIVTTSSATASATNVTYTISFSEATAIGKGSDIDIVFPTGTGNLNNISRNQVTINGINDKINTAGLQSGTTIRINLSNSNGNDVPAGPITIIITSITNTSTLSSSKTMSVTTPNGSSTSSNFTISSSTAVTVGTVSLSSSTVSAVSSYTISTTLTTSHAIGDQLTVTFPAGTVLPATISAANVTVGGNAATSVSSNPSTGVAVITLGAIFTTGNVIFSTGAAIANPPSNGTKTLTVSSNLQSNAGTSSNYTINTSSTLTAANVVTSPSTVNTISQYSVSFSTGNSGALTANSSTITLTFPSGTSVPSSISASSATVNGTAANSVVTDVSARTVVITSGVSVSNNTSVTVILQSGAVVINPLNSGSYTIQVKTSSETTNITSNSYSITESTVSVASITLGTSALNTLSTYSFSFSVGAGGALTANSSTLTFTFPTTTNLSSTGITASSITVNGSSVTVTPTINNTAKTVEIISPINISNSGLVTVIFNSGITNPTSTGTVTASVKSSVETTNVTTQSYIIQNATSVTGLSFTRTGTNNTQRNAGTITYNLTFTTSASGAIGNNTQGTITVTFPSGFNISGATASQPSAVTASNYAVTRAGSSVILTFDRNGGNALNANTSVTVAVTGVTNPSTAKSNYQIGVSTSADVQVVYTSNFTIFDTVNPTSVTFSPTPSTSNTNSAYQLQFTNAANTQLTAGRDTIFVTFPSGTTVPSSIANEDLTVNNISAYSNSISGQVVRIVTPSTLSAGSTVTVSFGIDAGILNPAVATNTNYQGSVKVSCATSSVNSSNYQITTLTNISSASVVPNPVTKSNTNTAYTIAFSTANALATASNDSIIIKFRGSMLPNNSTAQTRYSSITINGSPLTAGTQLNVYEGDSVIAIRSPVNISANTTATVVFSSGFGITNPATAGAYTIRAKTTANTTYVTSSAFTITNSTVGAITVSVTSSSTVGAAGTYSINFTTGTGGALSGGSQKVYLIFPLDTSLPSSIAAANLTINGVDASAVQISKTNAANQDTVIVTVPSGISASSSVTLNISSAAGILNPTTAGSSYTLKVYTDSETSLVTSSSYTISSATAVSNVVVTPVTSSTASATNISYTVSFTPNAAITATTSNIFVTFPTGFTLPATIAAGRITVGNGTTTTGTAGTTSLSGTTYTILSPVSATASNTVTVTFATTAGIGNPSSAKSSYTNSVYASAPVAQQQVSSSTFSIISGNAPTAGNISVSPNTASSVAAYSISFTTSANGALAVGDKIILTFPSGTTLPSSISASAIKVNNVTVSVAPTISAQQVTITIPSQIAVSTVTTVDFTSAAGIQNPTAGSYTTLQVKTTTDATNSNENSYTIATNSTLSPATVTLSPATVNTSAAYTLVFNNNGSSTTSSDSLTITFPSGTTVPTTISTSNVSINGTAVSYVRTDVANKKVFIKPTTTVSADASISLVFAGNAGLVNPSTTGSNTLTVKKNILTGVTSSAYSITASQVTSASVSVTPGSVSVAGTYTIAFNVGAGGALTGNSSTITLTFPTGTTFPASMAANEISVNGTSVTSTPTIDQTNLILTFTTPVSVANNSAVSVIVNSTGGIINPGTAASNYTLTVKTNIETTAISSQTYTIASASSVSAASVTLSVNTVSSLSEYLIKFKTNSTFVNGTTTVTIVFPSGTTIGSAVNGTPANTKVKKNFNGTEANAGTVSVSGNNVTVTIPGTSTFSSSADTAYIRFTNAANMITNPSTAGSNKTVSVQSSLAPTYISSNKYSVVTSSAITSVTASASPSTSSTTAGYSVNFATSSNGPLFTSDYINITFPSGTTLPGSISSSAISVNSVTCTSAPIITGQILKVAIPSNINASTSVSVVINSSAGIVNPTAGSYTVSVNSSVNTGSGTSGSYTISNSATITASTVTLSNSTVNTVSSYTLDFTNGTTAINSGGTFVITFPSGTTVPAGITSNVTVTSGSPLTSKTVTAVASNNGSRTITITMGATIAASDPVRIAVASAAGVINPSTASVSNTLTVSATGNGTVTSNTYTTTASTISSATVSLTSSATSATANYTIAFTTGAGGALTTGNTITIVFPTGTVVSGASTANTTINGGAPTAVNISSQTVTLTYSSVNSGAIGNNSAVSLVFNSLTNPSSANANASVTVNSTAEATAVISNTYQITTGTTVSPATVTLGTSTKTAGTLSQYTIVFNLGSAGALTTGSTKTISIVFPSGTTLGSALTTVANTTLNGVTPQSVSVSSQTVTITKTSASATIANSGTVTIVFTNVTNMITNPAIAQSNYTVGVSTSIEPTIITSNKYAVLANSNAMTSATVTPSDNYIGHNSTYSISFTTGSNGKLLVGDKVYLTFPSGFTIAQIAAGNVQVNSTPTTAATTVSGQQFAVTLPVNVNSSTAMTIDLLDASKITNTATSNFYSLNISSDIETANKTSQSFGIAGPDGTLPVELTDFTAKNYRDGVMVEWTTASELNNAFFKLFRKEKRSREFVEVTKISGKGTTSEQSNYRFIDSKLEAGKIYEYQLRDYAYDGQIRIHDLIEVELELPKTFNLEQNFPNPFNPQTIIPYSVPVDSRITIEIYNLLGQKVKTLVDDDVKAGTYYPMWNGKNDNGVTVASSVYFVHMQTNNQTNNFSKTLKITMMK